MDREASERALEDAAIEILDRDGVLAGLNLREVAEAANVNRGLVYHYFGSRRDLLRAATARDAAPRLKEIAEGLDRGPIRQQLIRLLRQMIQMHESVRLTTLLVLDRDPSVRLMPLKKLWLDRLDAAPDVDREALLAFISAATYGYVLYRKKLAAELELGVRALDRRIEALLEQLLDDRSA